LVFESLSLSLSFVAAARKNGVRERREKKRKVEVKEKNHFPLREIGSLFCFFYLIFSLEEAQALARSSCKGSRERASFLFAAMARLLKVRARSGRQGREREERKKLNID
jgi:hypothetical protein